MQTQEAFRARKSYRGEFRPEPVARDVMREILEAGVLAPSGCNQQTTAFIGVDDPALARQLAEIYGRPWALSAPAAILLLTQPTPSYRGNSYHVQDYAAAAENLLLAIADWGYASTWIEGQIEGEPGRAMGRLLGVPPEWTVAVYLPFGRPAQPVTGPAKKPFEARAYFNRYGG